jgi:hypothetical protein
LVRIRSIDHFGPLPEPAKAIYLKRLKEVSGRLDLTQHAGYAGFEVVWAVIAALEAGDHDRNLSLEPVALPAGTALLEVRLDRPAFLVGETLAVEEEIGPLEGLTATLFHAPPPTGCIPVSS